MAHPYQQVLDKLALPLDPKSIRKRQGPGGKKLEYIDHATAIMALNDAFTPLGWSRELAIRTTEIGPNADPKTGETKKGWSGYVSAIVTLRLHPTPGIVIASQSDVGHGTAENMPTLAAAVEKAEKEAATDALKRAAHALGSRLGLALYVKDLDEREDLGLVGTVEEKTKPAPDSSLGVDFESAPDQRTPAPAPKQIPAEDPTLRAARWLLESTLDPIVTEAIRTGSRPGDGSLVDGALPADPVFEELAELKPLVREAVEDLARWPSKDALTRPLLAEVHQAAEDALGKDEVMRLWRELGVELRRGVEVSGYQARLLVAAAGAVAQSRLAAGGR